MQKSVVRYAETEKKNLYIGEKDQCDHKVAPKICRFKNVFRPLFENSMEPRNDNKRVLEADHRCDQIMICKSCIPAKDWVKTLVHKVLQKDSHAPALSVRTDFTSLIRLNVNTIC